MLDKNSSGIFLFQKLNIYGRIKLVKSVCSARDSGWGNLEYWGYVLGNTLVLKTQDAVSIKESK